MDEQETVQAPAASWRQLVLGVLVWGLGGLAVLLAAGFWGVAGVAVTAAVEAIAIYALYRWSPS